MSTPTCPGWTPAIPPSAPQALPQRLHDMVTLARREGAGYVVLKVEDAEAILQGLPCEVAP